MKTKFERILFVTIPILLFVLLAVFVNTGVSLKYELEIYNYAMKLNSNLFTIILKLITNLVSPIVIIIICSLLLIFKSTRKSIGLPVLFSIGLAIILNTILKLAFSRQRPDVLRMVNETGYSFPSAHAMISFAMYFMIIFIVCETMKNSKVKYAISGLLIIVSVLICFSRIYLGVHYFCDVLGGALLGFEISYIIWIIMRNNKK